MRSIVEFGAVGDGASDSTAAVQAAVDATSQAGQVLLFPAGDFVTGTVRLRDHTHIVLSSRAVWRASPRREAHERLPADPTDTIRPHRVFILAHEVESVNIDGPGTIHGSGEAEAFLEHRVPNSPERSFGLHFTRCRHVRLGRGLRLRNSSFWMQRYFQCRDVVLDGIDVFDHCNLNNDGIDVDSCRRVLIANATIDASDDAICLKSHSRTLCEDVAVTNCVISSHASAIKLGTGSYGGFRNVVVGNCVVRPSRAEHVEHPFKLPGGIAAVDLGNVDGGAMENIAVHGLVVDGVETPVFIRHGARRPTPDDAPVSRTRGISITDVRAVNAGPYPCCITGLPDAPVADVRLRGIDITVSRPGSHTPHADEAADDPHGVPERVNGYPMNRMFDTQMPAWGLYARHVRGLDLRDVRLRNACGDAREAVVTVDVAGDPGEIVADGDDRTVTLSTWRANGRAAAPAARP